MKERENIRKKFSLDYLSSEEPRYYVETNMGPNAPIDEGIEAALVDEEAGGEIAYFLCEEVANRICKILNKDKR